MEPQLSHHETEELLGAYALDAVEPGEAAAVEAHLEHCARCRDEVASHREVAAFLAYVGAKAPDGVWKKIADSLEEPPPELRLARVVPLSSAPSRRLLPARPVAALAASAAVVIGLLGFQVQRQDGRIDRLLPAVEARGLDEAVAAALFDSGSRRVELASDNGDLFANAVVKPDGRGYLVRHNLPELPDEQTYQLWGLVGDRTVSLGVLGTDPDVSAFSASADVSVLAVTAERAGGVATTTKQPVVRGFLAT